MSTKTNTVNVLNQLIQMHHDRIEGYRLAARVLKERDARLLQIFENCCEDSKHYIAQLAEHVWGNHGKAQIKPSGLGKIFRLWMILKCNLLSRNRSAVIALCLWGEYAMQKAYETARYRTDEVTDEAANLIDNQHGLLKRQYHEQRANLQNIPLVAG